MLLGERINFYEDSLTTIKREIKEEIGIEIIKECKNLKNKQKENNKEQQLSNTRKKVLIKDGFTSINILIIMIILITIILAIIFIK